MNSFKENEHEYFISCFYRQNSLALSLFAGDEAPIAHNNDNYIKGASMNFMALITARFADLPFFTPAAKKPEKTPKPNTVRAKRSSTADRDTPTQLGPYRCTSIVFEDCACDAVKAIGRKRFLAVDRDTPTLPLSECDRSKCNCKYMRHNDRREEEDDDRRLAAALQTALYEDNGNEDRRMKKRGRRKTDS